VTYLIDTSALLRILRNEVDPAWRDVARRGLIMLCEPVIAETLVSVDARSRLTTCAGRSADVSDDVMAKIDV
jgi:predicted nucleic acid-binding protein